MRIPDPSRSAGWATALSLFLLAPAAGQSPTPQSPPQETPPELELDDQSEPDDSARPLRRILFLRGGTTLRRVARATEGGWEYKQKGAWHALPSAAVERVESEREVIAELRRREREVDKDDLDGRAGIAAWAFETGLLEEALKTADIVLAKDPDHGAARTAVLHNAHRFRVPELGADEQELKQASDALLRWAAARPASMREMALMELARVRERDELRGVLLETLFANSIGMRSFAALALRRLFPGEEIKPLLGRAVLDASENVRVEASRALRDASHPGLVVPVAKALLSSNVPRVRIQAAEALGHMAYPAAVEPLVARLAALQGSGGHGVPHSNIFIGRQFAYVQDFDVEVAQFQAVADPQINVLIEGQVTDAGVIAVKEIVAAERSAIRGALGGITGANPGRTSRAWLNWWEENGESWRAARHADPGTPTTASAAK